MPDLTNQEWGGRGDGWGGDGWGWGWVGMVMGGGGDGWGVGNICFHGNTNPDDDNEQIVQF